MRGGERKRRRITLWLMRALTVAALSALIAAAWLGAGTPQVRAAGLSPVVADCNAHAALTRHYSIAQLRAALSSIPADVAEYSNCHDVIQHQLLSQLGELPGGNGSGGGGGSFLPTWLIVVLAVLAAGAAGFGALAVRDRRKP